jgi:dipeptidase
MCCLCVCVGSSTFADEYPFSVRVESGGLTVADVLAMHRDHYEGTAYDLTRGLAAGPYGDPSRFDPGENKALYRAEGHDDDNLGVDETEAWAGRFERAISIYRCAYSFVSQSRPHVDNSLGVVWFGQYAPHASTAVPLYVGISQIPAPYTTGSLSKFSLDSSYWVHAAVGNWANRFYVHTIGDIQAGLCIT